MELVLLIAVVWILVLPAGAVLGLLSASALLRRRATDAGERLAVVVPLRGPSRAPGRRVA